MSFATLRDRVNAQALKVLGEQALIGLVLGVKADMAGTSVDAVFDNAFLAVLGIESSNPLLRLKSTDAANVKHGFSVIFAGIYYTVVGIHPDGDGITGLELEKA